MDNEYDVIIQLAAALDHVADNVVERGTQSEFLALEAMGAAARPSSPGAAAALVDYNGSEVSRLRAFGVVHGVVSQSLPPALRLRLLDAIRGTEDLALTG